MTPANPDALADALARDIAGTLLPGDPSYLNLEYILRRGYAAVGCPPNSATKMCRKLAECQAEDQADADAFRAALATAEARAAQLQADLQRVTAERDEAREEAYDLKLAAAGGEDIPGSASLVTADDVRRWRDEETHALRTAEARAAQLQAEVEAERQRANEAVIRAGAMEQERNHLRYHYDAAMAAATNDELPANIKQTLAERVAWYRDRWLYVHPALVRSRAEVEALKAKLTEAAEAADAPPSGYSTYQTSIDSEEAHNLRRCREIVRAARTALAARAATAREG